MKPRRGNSNSEEEEEQKEEEEEEAYWVSRILRVPGLMIPLDCICERNESYFHEVMNS